MENQIVETLQLMCDKDNPQDKKLLLLAELVETKCEALAENQRDLKSSLKNTNEKLDKLTGILEKYEKERETCPIYKNKSRLDFLSIALRHPKLSLLIIAGLLTLLINSLSLGLNDIIKIILDL